MAFSRVAALLHAALSDVVATQHHTATVAGDLNHQDLAARGVSDHHTATVAGDLNLANMAERLHASLASVGVNDHLSTVTQANMEDEGTAPRAIRPDRVRFSPGVAKAHCHIATDGTLDSPSYNVASVTDTGTGNRTIVWDDDFSSVIYAPVTQQTEVAATSVGGHCIQASLAVGSMVFETRFADGSGVTDFSTGTIACGDQ